MPEILKYSPILIGALVSVQSEAVNCYLRVTDKRSNGTVTGYQVTCEGYPILKYKNRVYCCVQFRDVTEWSSQIFTHKQLGIVGDYPRTPQGEFLYGGFPVTQEQLAASGWVPSSDPGYRGHPPKQKK